MNVPPLASLPELSLGALPPRELALGFGTIKASSWRCSSLRPGVSPVFDRTESILGGIVSPLARLSELSLEALPPSLGFSTIKASYWRCSGLLQGVSPVFDRTETIREEIFSPFSRLPELSLEALPPRELSLGFGTIKASSRRCSGLYSIVQKLFWGKYFPHSPGFQSCLWKRFLPESSLSGLVPSRHRLGAVAVYCRGSFRYSIVQKLFREKSFPHSPGSQSCLWERFPPESSLSSSVQLRHILRAVAVYYRGSPKYSIVQKLFCGKCFPHSPGSQSRLWERFLPKSSVSVSVPSSHLLSAVAVYYRGSPQYSIVQKLFWGKYFSPLARLPELSLRALPPRELALEFGTIKASSSRCSGLLPRVSQVFDRTETVLREMFSPLASLNSIMVK